LGSGSPTPAWNVSARGCPAPGYPEETRTVGSCLRVVMMEECDHRRYAVRDLAVLEADLSATAARPDAAT